MVMTRALLGALEAGMYCSNIMPSHNSKNDSLGYFPGCVYLLSSWYVRCKYESTWNGSVSD